MSRLFSFSCDSCGYRVESCLGDDAGWQSVVRPYVCAVCSEVVNVRIGEFGEIYKSEELTGQRAYEFYRCPACHGGDITPWDADTPSCPKCGAGMEKVLGGGS